MDIAQDHIIIITRTRITLSVPSGVAVAIDTTLYFPSKQQPVSHELSPPTLSFIRVVVEQRSPGLSYLNNKHMMGKVYKYFQNKQPYRPQSKFLRISVTNRELDGYSKHSKFGCLLGSFELESQSILRHVIFSKNVPRFLLMDL